MLRQSNVLKLSLVDPLFASDCLSRSYLWQGYRPNW